jgi:hypothetical protein
MEVGAGVEHAPTVLVGRHQGPLLSNGGRAPCFQLGDALASNVCQQPCQGSSPIPATSYRAAPTAGPA